jgi:hypothetical protein
MPGGEGWNLHRMAKECYEGRAWGALLPTPVAEPTFMGMPEILTPVYWTAPGHYFA